MEKFFSKAKVKYSAEFDVVLAFIMHCLRLRQYNNTLKETVMNAYKICLN